jgi:hypothetical protein
MKVRLGSIAIWVGSFCIDAVPHLREGYSLSGEGFFESLVEAFEDAIVGGFVGVGFLLGKLLEAFEDEGFEGEVLLGGELDELLFEVLGDLDGAHGLGSLVGGVALS